MTSYCTELEPSFPIALTLRKCRVKLQPIKTTDREDLSLSPDDNVEGMGILQKADVLYQSGNFELALVYYHRGFKLFPKVQEFRDGIKKAQKSSEKAGRKMKLTAIGDLSCYTHKSPPLKAFARDKKQKTKKGKDKLVPSAGFRSRQMHPLVKVHKAPSVRLQESNATLRLLAGSLDSLVLGDKLLEETSDKSILGELYEDKEYLEYFVGTEAYENSKTQLSRVNVGAVAEEGLCFLEERSQFWDSLGPLPPPRPSRKTRSLSRLGLSRLSHYNSTDSLATFRSGSTWQSTETLSTIRSKNTGRSTNRSRRNRQQGKTSPNTAKMNFDFVTYQRDEDLREMTEIPEETQDIGREETEEEIEERRKEEEKKRGEETRLFITKEMEEIDTAYLSGHLDQCAKKASNCLQILNRFSVDEIPTKDVLKSTLYSCLGNCAMQMKNYDSALKNHQKDLSIGEESGVVAVRSRALGNLGRVHVLMGKYDRALDLYNQKAPLCTTPKETAWLFHEIGNCFLMMKIFQNALESGQKALRAAHGAEDMRLQLQNTVLVGVSEVNLSRYRDAYQHFEEALDLAKILDDKKAQDAMTKALVDVNKKMVTRMKKKKTDKKMAPRSKSPKTYNVHPKTPVSIAAPVSAKTNVSVEG